MDIFNGFYFPTFVIHLILFCSFAESVAHVGEMKERITTQIKVIKDKNGRSRIEIV